MKYSGYITVIAVLFFACNKNIDSEKRAPDQPKTDSIALANATTSISFDVLEYNFGKVKQGEIVKKTFTFTNTGTKNLIISNASASCGCTVPNWPKGEIKPGHTDNIDVQFNSTGKSGVQNKTVVITANTVPNTTTLVMKGEVESPVAQSNK